MHPFALPHAGQLLPLLALSRPVTNLDLICMVWHRFAPLTPTCTCTRPGPLAAAERAAAQFAAAQTRGIVSLDHGDDDDDAQSVASRTPSTAGMRAAGGTVHALQAWIGR